MLDMNGSHPLVDVGLSINHFKSFGEDGGGFTVFQPINIVIGRNNTGKSALIDAVELCITEGKSFDASKHGRPNFEMTVQISQKLDEPSLRNAFTESTSGGGVPGDHWQFGKQFIGQTLRRRYGRSWQPSILEGPNFDAINKPDR